MVRFTMLASGSRGNSSVVASSRTRILVDCGLSCRELLKRLATVEENAESLDAIIVTHEHQDHVNGVAVTARKLGVPVYFTQGTYNAWKSWLNPKRKMTYAQWIEMMKQNATERAERNAGPDEVDNPAAELPAKSKDRSWLPAVEIFEAGREFQIGDISVTPFTIPHDAADPVGFVFAAEGIRIGYATDLGYLPANVKEHLKNLDVLLLESNHDPDMLRDGPYPWSIKQRVLSRTGHLSNEAAAAFITEDYDGSASHVILGHISESNNLPELARISVERALAARADHHAARLLVASQTEPLRPVCF